MNDGWGDLDTNVVFRLQEEAPGSKSGCPASTPAWAARLITTHLDA